MSGSQWRTAQEDSISPVLFPGYPATWLPIKWSSVWCLLHVPLSAPSQRPCQRRSAVANPSATPTPSEGADATPCPKKAVIAGWMGDCYISTRLPTGLRLPEGARFQTSTRRIGLHQKQKSHQEWTWFQTDTSKHQKQPKEWGYWLFLGGEEGLNDQH